MRKPLSTICFELAKHAAEADHELLAYMLRMAAGEALACQAQSPDTPTFSGVFDWDVSGDVTHMDRIGAELFGIDSISAAKGLPVGNYLPAIHPDDIGGFLAVLNTALQSGGDLYHEYRLTTGGRERLISAQGIVTLDTSRRPLRFAGIVLDISKTKMPIVKPHGVTLN